jgi:putative NIF3 family GTP cyclohydrolase 1 type 2
MALPDHPIIFHGVTTIKANNAEGFNHSIRPYRIEK